MTHKLAINHDSRSVIAVVKPGSGLSKAHRLEYLLPGDVTPHHIDLPKMLFPNPLEEGQQVVLTLTYTQAVLRQEPEQSKLILPGAPH